MAIITLTTDFGLKDHYVSAIKGAIYSYEPSSIIVDISHHISPFNYTEAAYIIKNAYQSFPEGTIHIIGVDSELSPENEHLAMLLDGHYFICANNGILSMLSSSILPEKLVTINIHNDLNDNFPVKNIFTKVATHIARGGNLDVIGKPFNKLKEVTNLSPVVNNTQDLIVGNVLYVDHYGNVVTNITKELIQTIAKGRDYTVLVRNYTFKTVYNAYSECVNFNIPKEKRQDDGKRLALFNANNNLEIAIYKSNLNTVGGASSLLGLSYRDTISVKFNS
ncbi:SAM hydrolase/SAM-dependent halogenase family protein [Pseudofulvibacter geojedonensis]|uniref:S-adenosyl-l-methionine hydroxide adenosyltransferase family protein n=1 Tax=Pseudofulvibacter geojedonensis TaxID=1123758 RepID=A0ABW3HYH7_9FLAO